MPRGFDRFFEAEDYVTTINKQTGELFIDFIGVDGRLYQIREQDVLITVMNFPSKADIDHFMNLKKQTHELYKSMKLNENAIDDSRNIDVI